MGVGITVIERPQRTPEAREVIFVERVVKESVLPSGTYFRTKLYFPFKIDTHDMYTSCEKVVKLTMPYIYPVAHWSL